MNKANAKRVLSITMPVVALFVAFGCGMWLLGREFWPLLRWWAALLGLGVAALPISLPLFRRFHDGGWLFSKTLGLALAGWLLWVLSSLHWVAFRPQYAVIAVGAVFLAGVLAQVLRRTKRGGRKPPLPRPIHGKIAAMLTAEALFLVLLLIWAVLRSFRPAAFGTEKFMDYGLLQNLMRTDFMPPQDIWFAGEPLNYYYFGQYLAAFILKLAGVSAGPGYNLMMATLPAFGFSLSYTLAYNLARLRPPRRWGTPEKRGRPMRWYPPACGALAGLGVMLGGNLHYLFFRFVRPVFAWMGLVEGGAGYYFPDSTRYIGYNPPTADKTIHEFPSYSFVLGDLHAHALNLIMVLTLLGVLLVWLWRRKGRMNAAKAGRTTATPVWWREVLRPECLLLGFLLGLFMATNYWDFPIYYVVVGAVMLFSNAVVCRFGLRALLATAGQGLVIAGTAVVTALPFSIPFTMIASEVELVRYRTPVHQLALLWGLPAAVVLVFLVSTGAAILKKRGRIGPAEQDPEEKLHRRLLRGLSVPELFVVVMGLCGLGLLLVPELVYVKDIYAGEYLRSNTMFKFTYQASVLFFLCMSIIIPGIIWMGKKRGLRIAGWVFLVLLVLTFGYGMNAAQNYLGLTADNPAERTIDGSVFLAEKSPQDADAVHWLNSHVEGMAVILEAHGSSYTYDNRISVFTGLPTVLGWQTHEWLWRSEGEGGMPEEITRRQEDIDAIYTGSDPELRRALVAQYNIQYIYVGGVERERYPNLNLEGLLALGHVVLESDGPGGTSVLIKVKP